MGSESTTRQGAEGMTRPYVEGTPATDRARRNRRAIAILESFDEGDEAEQRETLAYLKRVIDEDRPGRRKHFP